MMYEYIILMSKRKREKDIDNSDNRETDEEYDSGNEISEEFKNHVKEFTRIDDLIKKKQKEIKDLKNQNKPHEEYILNDLDQMGENTIEITDGKLIKNKSQTKAPLNTTIIREAISAKINNPQIINEIMEQMKELRPKKERKYLKRTQIRKLHKKIKT